MKAINPTSRGLLRRAEGALECGGPPPLSPVPPSAREILDAITKPTLALSLRPPWAWLIVNGYTPVENREWRTHFRGDLLIHASATMTKDDYATCVIFIAPFKRRWRLPAYDILRQQCGGIVGQARLTDCVEHHNSDWFTGPYGFVMANAKPLPFRPCKGKLKFFEVSS